ncbi:MAG TPA: galactose oxidase-like domain-containing protein [Ramlibacter sp.]|nr:galactose oxidase-like domain-containing protein [Ramlibacter sp.]
MKRDTRWARTLHACAAGASSLLFLAGAHANSQVGAWEVWRDLPFFPVHSHMLPTGNVLIWPGDQGISGDDGRLLDPNTQILSHTPKADYDLFCSGHAFLPDGTLLVAGGHIANNVGLAKASRYNPANNSWIVLPDMNAGRWYPTVTTLANGDALVVSGDIDTTLGVNRLPQVYQRSANSWRDLSNAQLGQALYPMMMLAPNGRVVEVAPSPTTPSLDTSGTGQWTTIASHVNNVFRDYGSAVMYADGKVLVVGGGDPPTATAETIDLNQSSPTWSSAAPMSIARRQLNATVLPDGTVLVTGGTSGPGFNNMNTPVFQAQIWNPDSGAWTTMASATKPRLYHSSATLLPDGSVLTMGGNGQITPEVFKPPYLFKGTRPAITSTPTVIGYGQSFTVQSDRATSIAKVTLIRLTSVTHSFNENQRLNVLSFTSGAGAVQVTAPANGNIAPPGHYLLFLVDTNGVPSIGSIVQLSADAPPPPPPAPATLTSLAPNAAPAGSPGFTLAVNGSGFVSGATVRWNTAARTTTFVSATQLSAQIPATDVATAGTANVTVVNPNAAVSNALPFTITAAVPRYRLTVTKSGAEAGKGTVTSSPAGISCGSTCTALFNSGTNVTLSVKAVGKVRFAGWSGACTGTGACVVPMNVDKAVTATFERR